MLLRPTEWLSAVKAITFFIGIRMVLDRMNGEETSGKNDLSSVRLCNTAH
jgi:hypothetical protein